MRKDRKDAKGDSGQLASRRWMGEVGGASRVRRLGKPLGTTRLRTVRATRVLNHVVADRTHRADPVPLTGLNRTRLERPARSESGSEQQQGEYGRAEDHRKLLSMRMMKNHLLLLC